MAQLPEQSIFRASTAAVANALPRLDGTIADACAGRAFAAGHLGNLRDRRSNRFGDYLITERRLSEAGVSGVVENVNDSMPCSHAHAL